MDNIQNIENEIIRIPNQIQKNKCKFADLYKIEKLLGKGAFSFVFKVQMIKNNYVYAVKVRKEKLNPY